MQHAASEKDGCLVPHIKSTLSIDCRAVDFNNSEIRYEIRIRAGRVILGINIFSQFEASNDGKDLYIHCRRQSACCLMQLNSYKIAVIGKRWPGALL